jgi:hypothetical protein
MVVAGISSSSRNACPKVSVSPVGEVFSKDVLGLG